MSWITKWPEASVYEVWRNFKKEKEKNVKIEVVWPKKNFILCKFLRKRFFFWYCDFNFYFLYYSLIFYVFVVLQI